jgi:hypothetical protein
MFLSTAIDGLAGAGACANADLPVGTEAASAAVCRNCRRVKGDMSRSSIVR